MKNNQRLNYLLSIILAALGIIAWVMLPLHLLLVMAVAVTAGSLSSTIAIYIIHKPHLDRVQAITNRAQEE